MTLTRYARKVFNLPTLWLRRWLWRIHPKRWSADLDDVPIDRPIFLLSVQGGGLTLITRMLRRHPDVVCVTGNHTYWAGPDEMQNVMGPMLPPALTGLQYKIPPHSQYPERGWLYAIDDLLPLYRQTETDATPHLREQFRRAIRIALKIHGSCLYPARFIDKSQTFTVRVALINALLEDCEPRFILVTRNPYAVCYRAAMRKTPLARLSRSDKERLSLAGQHWANSFYCALRDFVTVEHSHIVRFEDVLREPEEHIQTLCKFVDLDFSLSMLPAPDDTFPLGATGSSAGDNKWYPLRSDVNKKYLDRLESWMIDILNERVAALAYEWRYTAEGP